MGARPVGVIVTEVRDHTFHASLRIEDAEGTLHTLSCRPSDACAVAVRAEVPLKEMFGYATDLRSLTQGRATFTMEFDQYAEAPKNVADEIISKMMG